MPKILRVREMTKQEQTTIERQSRSRTALARQVERARIVQWASEGQQVPEIAARLGVRCATGSIAFMRPEWLDSLMRANRTTTYI
jgi:hypothetical protein